MKRIPKRWLSVFTFFLLIIAVFATESLEIVTSEYPPYNYMEDNKILGFATEIVIATIKEAEINGDISMYPWSRAYAIAQEKPNVLIYSIIRTKERENLFRWVGEYAPNQVYIYASETNNLKIKKLSDAQKYKIGVTQDDYRETFLLKRGFSLEKQLIRSYSNENNILNIVNNRLDLVPENSLIVDFYLKKHKIDSSALKKVYYMKDLSELGFYFALSKTTSDEIYYKLQKAYETIKKNGTYKQIYKKYF